ncbi:hypothetical protein B0J11DRAFT_503892 [Dendryphion nanum]|uniref:Uncharacterized protein n=1 Tax=Dendryphion nanum TaxID=256645 RepID=A0A9P9E3J5_9PLEO|nr:hypothetical protein B0J11DRAFT_503892 [Dendryphion nanum]
MTDTTSIGNLAVAWSLPVVLQAVLCKMFWYCPWSITQAKVQYYPPIMAVPEIFFGTPVTPFSAAGCSPHDAVAALKEDGFLDILDHQCHLDKDPFHRPTLPLEPIEYHPGQCPSSSFMDTYSQETQSTFASAIHAMISAHDTFHATLFDVATGEWGNLVIVILFIAMLVLQSWRIWKEMENVQAAHTLAIAALHADVDTVKSSVASNAKKIAARLREQKNEFESIINNSSTAMKDIERNFTEAVEKSEQSTVQGIESTNERLDSLAAIIGTLQQVAAQDKTKSEELTSAFTRLYSLSATVEKLEKIAEQEKMKVEKLTSTNSHLTERVKHLEQEERRLAGFDPSVMASDFKCQIDNLAGGNADGLKKSEESLTFLRDRVDIIESRINDAEEIGALKSDIDNIDNEIGALKSGIHNMDKKLSAHKDSFQSAMTNVTSLVLHNRAVGQALEARCNNFVISEAIYELVASIWKNSEIFGRVNALEASNETMEQRICSSKQDVLTHIERQLTESSEAAASKSKVSFEAIQEQIGEIVTNGYKLHARMEECVAASKEASKSTEDSMSNDFQQRVDELTAVNNVIAKGVEALAIKISSSEEAIAIDLEKIAKERKTLIDRVDSLSKSYDQKQSEVVVDIQQRLESLEQSDKQLSESTTANQTDFQKQLDTINQKSLSYAEALSEHINGFCKRRNQLDERLRSLSFSWSGNKEYANTLQSVVAGECEELLGHTIAQILERINAAEPSIAFATIYERKKQALETKVNIANSTFRHTAMSPVELETMRCLSRMLIRDMKFRPDPLFEIVEPIIVDRTVNPPTTTPSTYQNIFTSPRQNSESPLLQQNMIQSPFFHGNHPSAQYNRNPSPFQKGISAQQVYQQGHQSTKQLGGTFGQQAPQPPVIERNWQQSTPIPQPSGSQAERGTQANGQQTPRPPVVEHNWQATSTPQSSIPQARENGKTQEQPAPLAPVIEHSWQNNYTAKLQATPSNKSTHGGRAKSKDTPAASAVVPVTPSRSEAQVSVRDQNWQGTSNIRIASSHDPRRGGLVNSRYATGSAVASSKPGPNTASVSLASTAPMEKMPAPTKGTVSTPVVEEPDKKASE